MKKISKILLIVVICSTLFLPILVKADQTAYTKNYELNLRSKANDSSSSTVVGVIPPNTEITIKSNVSPVNSTVSWCLGKWYYVNAINKNGYVCGQSITIVENVTNNSYATQLRNAGFPESYVSKLVALHQQHSNWVFTPLKTNLDWGTVITNESKVGVSLIQGDEGYRSTAAGSYDYATDKFKALDGSNWYAANYDTVAYYMDPRHYLNEINIFAFLDLSYNSTYQTSDIVKSVLSTTKLGNYDSNYVNSFMTAASNYHVNPIHLASRVRQEIGTSTSVISGASFTYNNKTYSKLYNPYNIGATSGTDNWKKGLIWANGGEGATQTTYGRPWNTLSKSIIGGAQFIAEGYINNNQNSGYLQKFNVANGSSKVAVHQYQTNIMAPLSEANITYNSYNSYGILNKPLAFVIPVFNNMPSSTSLPNTGNPNNYLKDLKVDGSTITGFSGGTTSYTKYVSSNTGSVNISATPLNSKSSVSGTGSLTLKSTETTQTLTVKAQNGATRKYTVKIVKSGSATNQSVATILSKAKIKYDSSFVKGINPGTTASTLINNISKVDTAAKVTITNSSGKTKTGTLATGDKITIKSGNESKTYTVVIYGDSNGDGKISSVDLLRTQKHILKIITLNGAYKEASDSNRDGKVSSVDLLKTQKHILKIATLKQ